MWRDKTLMLNGRCINEPNNIYPWKSYLINLLNYSREVQDTQLKCECWERDTAGHFDARAHDSPNVVYNTWAARFAEGHVVEMVGRPFLDLFQQDKLNPPGLNIAYRLTHSADGFVIK